MGFYSVRKKKEGRNEYRKGGRKEGRKEYLAYF